MTEVINRKDCSNKAIQVADELLMAFPWGETLEGHPFWSGVEEKLKRISKNYKNKKIARGQI